MLFARSLSVGRPYALTLARGIVQPKERSSLDGVGYIARIIEENIFAHSGKKVSICSDSS
jgi:hypothetical protein